MGLPYPRRNRFIFSGKSLEVMEGAELWRGLTQAEVSVEIEGRDPLYGFGVIQLGKPRGQLMVEVNFTFEAASFFEWRKAHPQFLDEIFDLTITIQEGANRHLVELRGVTDLKSTSLNSSH